MTKHRQLIYGATIPQDWLDAIQELLGTYVSDNATVTVLNATTIQLSAGTVNDQVCLSVNGRWRYITSAVNATHPGGVAGIYPVFATASDNNFTIGPPEVDSTVYTFALAISAIGGNPGTALYRQIGTCVWNGTAITDVNLITDDPAVHGNGAPGDIIYSVSATRPGALLCDGTSYLRSTYPALFNAVGGAASPYGLPDGTHFQVPDFRGRTLLGVGTGTGLTARALGATGGEENHTLLSAESGVVAHTHAGATVPSLSVPSLSVPALSVPSLSISGTASGSTSAIGDHAHAINLADGYSASSDGGSGGYAQQPVGGRVTGNAGAHSHTFSGSLSGSTGTGSTGTGSTGSGSTGSGTTGTIPAASSASAASGHNNMQPWATGYIYVKI